MSQAEDIYQKLSKTQNTITKKEKARQEDLDALWSDAGTSQHNAKFGVPDYLHYLESYLQSKAGAKQGKFTANGLTVGECKLFATLHVCSGVKSDVLKGFPGLTKFYNRVAALKPTKGVLEGTLNMPGPFKPYFIP